MVLDLDFRTPITYGWKAFDDLKGLVPEGRGILITGRRSAKTLDINARVEKSLERDLDVFSGVEPNPSVKTVMKGSEAIKGSDPDFVLAVGGGSVIDAAKFMAVLAKHGGEVMDYINGRKTPPDPGYPIYAVPTTPGTSSEITPFSIVTVPEEKNKLGLRHPSIYPARAIIDPELTVSLPRDQTASTGFDILSHSVESYWSKNANPLSRQLCLNSIRLIRKHLKNAYDNGASRSDREGISMASIFAGLSFSNTGTTICHAISYPITVDTGLPHGMACALSLGPTFDLLVEKGAEGMDELAGSFGSTRETFREDLLSFMRSMDIPTDLDRIGFKGGPDRIMETNMGGLRKNFTFDITDEEIIRIILSI
ncbi:MAG: iron-containing alcohol dehydrogenase family protein [Thermoplasmatota archaeon]